MSQEFNISSGPLPGSEKIYVKGEMFDIEVPMRRINLSPTVDTDGTKVENEPVVVYDTSGPYTDPDYRVDLHKGLPKIHDAPGGQGRTRSDTNVLRPQRRHHPGNGVRRHP